MILFHYYFLDSFKYFPYLVLLTIIYFYLVECKF